MRMRGGGGDFRGDARGGQGMRSSYRGGEGNFRGGDFGSYRGGEATDGERGGRRMRGGAGPY